MFNDTPDREVTGSTFRDEHMNMRIPLKTAPKGVKNTNKSGSEFFGLIKVFKHKEDSISGSLKKKIKQGAIFSEKYS